MTAATMMGPNLRVKLRAAERRLSTICNALRELEKALPRVELHDKWYKLLASGNLPCGHAPALQEAETWEYKIPALDRSRPSTRVRLRELHWQAPPSPQVLLEELDAFYRAARSLFEKAKQIDTGGLCRDKLDFPAVEPLLSGERAEDAAYRHLRAARERNSVAEMGRRVRALQECWSEARRAQGIWFTPAERKQAVHSFCERHNLTLKQFAKACELSQSTIYNFMRGTLDEHTESFQIIREVIKEGNLPTKEQLKEIRERIQNAGQNAAGRHHP